MAGSPGLQGGPLLFQAEVQVHPAQHEDSSHGSATLAVPALGAPHFPSLLAESAPVSQGWSWLGPRGLHRHSGARTREEPRETLRPHARSTRSAGLSAFPGHSSPRSPRPADQDPEQEHSRHRRHLSSNSASHSISPFHRRGRLRRRGGSGPQRCVSVTHAPLLSQQASPPSVGSAGALRSPPGPPAGLLVCLPAVGEPGRAGCATHSPSLAQRAWPPRQRPPERPGSWVGQEPAGPDL